MIAAFLGVGYEALNSKANNLESTIADLNSTITNLNSMIANLTSTVTNLSTALPIIQQPLPYYLPYPTSFNENSTSQILVISATSKYGNYPFQPSNPYVGYVPPIQLGDPCFIINVTVRNDYSSETPFPANPEGNNTGLVYAWLTAEIFNAQGQINATDVTSIPIRPPGVGVLLTLTIGESESGTIYLATSNRSITGLEIVLSYITANTLYS